MRVGIVGSREYLDLHSVRRFVNALPSYWEIVSGGADGVDITAEKEARALGMKVKVFPADWDKHGKAAGYIRNKEIVKYSDWIVAFWDGESKGTKSTIDLAAKLGVRCDIKRVTRSKNITRTRWKHLKFGVFDLETTGVNPWRHELMEMALVICTIDGGIEDKITSLFLPSQMPDDDVQGLTKITPKMLKKRGIKPVKGAKAIRRALKDVDVLIAHNAPFDRRFLHKYLNSHLKKEWDPSDWYWLDTVVWAKEKWPSAASHRLDACAKLAGLPPPDKNKLHRALYDVEVTWEVLKHMLDDIPDDIDEVYDAQRRRGSIHHGWVDKAYVGSQSKRFMGKVPKFNFGKHKGRKLADVIKTDEWYIRFMFETPGFRLTRSQYDLIISTAKKVGKYDFEKKYKRP